MMNRVKEVTPMSDYRLDIVFRDGKRGVFDCRPYRDYPCLAGIWDEGVFTKVVADHGTVMWPDGSDLCPDEVYDKTVTVKPMPKKYDLSGFFGKAKLEGDAVSFQRQLRDKEDLSFSNVEGAIGYLHEHV